MAHESGIPTQQIEQGSSLNPSAPSFFTNPPSLPLQFTLPTAITPELQNLVRTLIKETLTENNNTELVDEEITDKSKPIKAFVVAKIFPVDSGTVELYILPQLKSFDAIIGSDSLKALDAGIFLKRLYMTLGDQFNIRIKECFVQNIHNIAIRDLHLNEEEREGIYQIIKQFPNLFTDPNKKLTYTTTVKAEINTTTNNPVYSRNYPYPLALQEEVKKQINELLEDGIIRPSKSAYNAPVWVVPKKTDASGGKKHRLVIDYRKLNEITIADRYPMPEVSEIISRIGEKKYHTTIDLKSGFHQIQLIEKDIQKTAFSVNNGKYEFTRLPFGLKNAPAIFQRCLDDILREHIGVRCFVYMDDIVISSEDLETHLDDLKKVFSTLEQANLKVQQDKCEFLKQEVEFLGFIISKDGIKTNPKKVEAINNFPIPNNIKELRSFLGLSGYYRRFIKGYANIAKPLTLLLRGDAGRIPKCQSAKVKINFNKEETDAFNKIKSSLVSRDVILTYPDYTKPFHLNTDASEYAIGAVLSQNKKPIAFISRTLNKTEENYATNEKEMLAIIYSLNTFRNYLYGTGKLIIETDHQPLTYALSNKNSNQKMKRWKAILEEYNYKMIYKPGKTNVVADALSRPQRVTQINTTQTLRTATHSNLSSDNNLIKTAEEPINVYKNQLILKEADNSSYQFSIVFPTYHRHTITEPLFTEENLTQILKKYLNPSVINGIHTDERTLGKIQQIYSIHFSKYRTRHSRYIVTDIINENEQTEEIIQEHNRAHRNGQENKLQLLRRMYFPKMRSKIEKITKECKVCKENKYERHPNNPIIQKTPIPQFPGHIVHIDLYFTNKKILLTAIDKFSKYVIVKILQSKATEDIKKPLRETIINFGIPNIVIFDNEKSFSSNEINFMLEQQYGIKIYKAPPYSSTSNGQIERFHSTFAELLRCIQTENTHNSFEELIDKAVFKYNYSIHSTTEKTPVEVFFGRPIVSNLPFDNNMKKEIVQKIKQKQEKDLNYHNKKRKKFKTYKIGQEIYVKKNKRIGNKLSTVYRKEIVKEDLNSTVTTQSGKIIHKKLIKN